MRILLTGASGFLGSHLLERLLDSNYEVTILKRSFSNIWRIKHIIHKVDAYDIDKEPLENAFKDNKIDAVLHTAADYGRNKSGIADVVQTNLMFSLKLLETATLYNTDTFYNTDTLLYKHLNHYTLSKKQFIEWLKFFSDRIKIVNLKIEHMYGPKDDEKKFVVWLLKQLINNVKYVDLTAGEQKRDFIYIDDVVNVYMLMLEKSFSFDNFQEFDVGTGKQIKLKDFILKAYNIISEKQSLQTKLNFGAIPYRKGEFMEIKENIEPLFNLGWCPEMSIEEGLNNTINFEMERI